MSLECVVPGQDYDVLLINAFVIGESFYDIAYAQHLLNVVRELQQRGRPSSCTSTRLQAGLDWTIRVAVDNMARPINDSCTTPLTNREWIVPRSRVVLPKPADPVGGSTSKRIHRLIVVTSGNYRASPSCEHRNHFEVTRIQVLVLIYNQQVVVHTVQIIMIPQSIPQCIREF